MSDEEINAALDQIFDEPAIPDAKAERMPELMHEPEAAPVEEPQGDENPPGYKDYETWVAEGKDPDEWRGKKAYQDQYTLLEDNRSIKAELNEIRGLLKTTVDATEELNNRAYQQGIAEAKADLSAATEDNDVGLALAAKDRLVALERQATIQVGQVNPIHSRFFAENPMLDRNNAQFDSGFMSEFERIYNGRLQADGVRHDQPLSDAAINGYMTAAMKSTKDLFPDKFNSPRNGRQTQSTPAKRATKKTDPVAGLKDMKVNTKNRQDANPAMDIYNMIKEKNPEEAKAFAEKMGVQHG